MIALPAAHAPERDRPAFDFAGRRVEVTAAGVAQLRADRSPLVDAVLRYVEQRPR